MKKLAALVAVLSALFLSGCTENIAKYNKPLRFKEVERFPFINHDGQGYDDAIIYLDTLTGVKYMYMWQGGFDGGPTITRLWDK